MGSQLKKKKARETLILRFRRKGNCQGKRSGQGQERKKNDIPEGSMGKKKHFFKFFLFQKKKTHFSQLTKLRTFTPTLSHSLYNFCQLIPHPSKKEKSSASSRCAFKDPPVSVYLKTHQSMCILRPTSHPSRVFLQLPLAYDSRRVCFWSYWMGAAPRTTLLHESSKKYELTSLKSSRVHPQLNDGFVAAALIFDTCRKKTGPI